MILLLDGLVDRVLHFVYWCLARRGPGNRLGQAKFLEHAGVEFPLRLTAKEVLLVPLLQTLPVSVELLQTVLPHFGDEVNRTPGYTSSFLQTVSRVRALVLAKHEILIVLFAIRPQEKRCTLEWCAGRTDFVHMRNIRGHRSRLDVALRRDASGLAETHAGPV